MTGNRLALDTNVAIRALNDDAAVVTWLKTVDEVFLPVTVLGELRFGAMKSARPQPNLARVEALASRCTVLGAGAATADAYASTRLSLLNKGRPIPENDIWIAATCLEHDLPLSTADAHFDEVDGLRVIRQP